MIRTQLAETPQEALAPAAGGAFALPDEEPSDPALSDDAWHALLERLSRQSVVKHFEAYADVPWDDPEFALDVEDPRFALPEDEPLGATTWYRSQPEAVRARLGAHMVATFMKIGVEFESVLKRGLLEFATRLPNGSPEFRYVYHEVIEEAQHSLMFQEFVNRTGLDVRGLPAAMRVGARQVVRFGRVFPELFFVFVLGGEDPIDHQQRLAMSTGRGFQHPLARRISQIHVIEEARHLSFARAYLRRRVPRLSPVKRHLLRIRAPLILGQMSRLMMQPSPHVARTYGIPRATLAEAYRRNPVHRQRVVDALAKVRRLCVELDVAAPPYDRLWRALGIWEA